MSTRSTRSTSSNLSNRPKRLHTSPLCTLTDALRHPLSISMPQRIVSLVPSQTELLCALGLQDRLVGRTRFCIHPEEVLKQVAVVGGTKDFNPDTIKALQPDLILANKEENVKAPLLALRKEIPVYTSDVPDLQAALVMIQEVSQLTKTQTQGQRLCTEIENAFARFSVSQQPLKVLYLIWRKPYMSIGNDTFIHNMLSQMGLQSITATDTRYPSLSPEAIRSARPDLIFLSSEPYPFKAKHVAELQALCPNAQVLQVRGDYFSWYGSRLKDAPAYFESILKQIGS